MQMGLWSGKLKHRMATQGGYSTVDLLNLTALIPDKYMTFLSLAALEESSVRAIEVSHTSSI